MLASQICLAFKDENEIIQTGQQSNLMPIWQYLDWLINHIKVKQIKQ